MENKYNAKYAFYYLLSLVALIFMALSIGMIGFEIVNKVVKDALSGASGSSTGIMQFAISALLISGPAFYLVSSLIDKGLRKGELDKESPIRRWLTYFILLVSSLVILGVFIGVINNFLSGELSLRFALKALIMLVLSGAAFSYYLFDIRRQDVSVHGLGLKIFLYASAAVALAAFVSAWFFVESPKSIRMKRLDQLVVTNISVMESAVNSYYAKYKVLPESMDKIESDPDLYIDQKSLKDPESGTPITYQKTGADSFKFCANFRSDNRNDDSGNGYAVPSKRHAAGYQCLTGDFWAADSIKGNTVQAQPAAMD